MVHIRRKKGWLAALALLLGSACSTGSLPEEMGQELASKQLSVPGNGTPRASGPSGDYSLFDLESEWWDQNGEIRPLSRLAGKVQILSMVYTHCAFSCPRILLDMKRLEAEFEERHGDRIGFVLVSVDPQRDSPDRLAKFAVDTRLDPRRWTLLSADEESILELAALIGVRYRRETALDFSHSNLIVVLDPAGKVVHRDEGGLDMAAMIAASTEALVR